MYQISIKKEAALIKPTEMFNHENLNKCFQQYSHGMSQNCYYINCGVGEKNLILIWYDEEIGSLRFSTENLASLKNLKDHVLVKEVYLDFNITCKDK